ncbi:Protein of unknown function DUF3468 [Penicillium atrosanguineum]|uniref:Protein of unknown function DUF3468 n=1 Tax=Penicillium atrosanguineum TaxID=1132637 RepID=UPI0023950E95|nr:Protein of unknown function DUF3468 [Penicillium atrosanguineum]KAJ5290214.1 Protein of unknown function DUF3468 [Penicillium atrosanguineum]
MYGKDSSDEENNGNTAEENDQEEPRSEESPAKVQVTSGSFSVSCSVSCSVMLRFPGESEPFFSPFKHRPSGNTQDCQNRPPLFVEQTREKGKAQVKIEDLGDEASKSSDFDQTLR